MPPSHHPSLSSRYPRVSSDGSQEADDADTSGVRLLLSSPKSSDTKDKEVWCTPEEILAMLLAGVKVRVLSHVFGR